MHAWLVLRRAQRRWLAVAVGVVAFVTVAVVLVATGGPRATQTLLVEDTGPRATPWPQVVATSPAAPPAPVVRVSTKPAAGPDHDGSADHDDSTVPSRCWVRTAPGEMSEPACDEGKTRRALPICESPLPACAYPDARGAVPVGSSVLRVTVREDDLHASWRIDPADLQGHSGMGPVREFVLRLMSHDLQQVLRTRRLPATTFAADLTGLSPGTYVVTMQELNASGLSPANAQVKVVIAGPSPSKAPPPSPSPSPSTSPRPTPTPTGSTPPTPSVSPSA